MFGEEGAVMTTLDAVAKRKQAEPSAECRLRNQEPVFGTGRRVPEAIRAARNNTANHSCACISHCGADHGTVAVTAGERS
jgi:hypothetical protein